METLTFNHGRLTFCLQTYEMVPNLPDLVEPRVQVHFLNEGGLAKTGFIGFEHLNDQIGDNYLWLHLTGTLDDDFWKALGAYAQISDENIKHLKNPHSRSFIEDANEGIFWTVLKPFVTNQFDGLETVNFFLGKKIIVTRQFSHDDVFTTVVHRLFAQEEHIAGFTCDRIASDLLEQIIRSYHDVLAAGGAKIEKLQTRIIKHPGKMELELINRAQQLVWIFLKSVWPIATVTQVLARSKNPHISAEGKSDFSNCHEEASSVLRLFETYREMSYDVMDVYVSGLGLRTNETTKILTIIATLFLPPTLIAGIYGMNFNIPEVHFPLGYYLCLGSMLVVSGGLLIWLKIRGYIDFK